MTFTTSEEAPDVSIHQGEDITIEVAVVDEAGAVKPLPGATIVFRIGNKRSNSFTFAKSGALVTDGSDGLIQVSLSDAETDGLPNREYDFQFIATDASGDSQVVFDGRINVDIMLPAS